MAALLAGAVCFSGAALANSGSSVGSPNVKKGATALEWRIAMGEDDENAGQDQRIRTRVHLDHAFTDIYAARLVYNMDRRKGDNVEYAGLSLQNRFYLIRAEDYGFDGGLRVNYTLADGDKKPDVLSLRLYQLIPAGKWEIRFNQILEQEIGEDRDNGLIAEWRSQATYAVNDQWRVGLDAFHTFGNLDDQSGYSAQEHAIGPVVKAKFGAGFSAEAAYRIGISDAANDQTATFILTKGW
jgi:hypothetical protein